MAIETAIGMGSITLRGDSRADIERLQQQMIVAASLGAPDTPLRITIRVDLGSAAQLQVVAEGHCLELEQLFEEYRKALGVRSARQMIASWGISRSTYYAWIKGVPISKKSIRILLAKAPNEHIREQLKNLLEGP